MLALGAAAVPEALAGSAVELGWNPVEDSRVDHYEIHFGTTSGRYASVINARQPTATVQVPSGGKTYYFAVRACDLAGANCSALSQEIAVPVPADGSNETPNPLTVDFAASTTKGTAPLSVTFTERSTGAVSSRRWSFGDGGASGSPTAVHTYTKPGVYTVELALTGPSGSKTAVKTNLVTVVAPASDSGSGGSSSGSDPEPIQALPIEIGDMAIDSRWRRIPFTRAFEDPIVVAKGLSSSARDPVVIRIKDIDGNGFSARVQEWGYSDDRHGFEQASYIVMERGRYELPGGIAVEAGSLRTDATGRSVFQGFSEPFQTVPVVFASVNTWNSADAVNSRVAWISKNGFWVSMWEQERNAPRHWAERIDYIAWEESVGQVNDLTYEVGRTQRRFNSKTQPLTFRTTFSWTPVFLAETQSFMQRDTIALRWCYLRPDSVRIAVQEESSRDRETWHVSEQIGYFVADVLD